MAKITEAQGTTSRLDTIRALLAKAEGASTDPERDAYTAKAAELIAKYGVDEAMLNGSKNDSGQVVDVVVWVVRPFGDRMQDLLRGIAVEMGAQTRQVKQHTGNYQVGQLKWQHGLRVFAFKSDLNRIEVMYTSLRNQALAGASRIKGEHKFGQDQKAHRESYLDGFVCAVLGRISRAEEAARQAAEAEREMRDEQRLLSGDLTVSRSVELVLADRRSVVRNTMTMALYGKSAAELDANAAASRERWAEMGRRAEERRQARIAEHASCKKCHAAKSGYCADHRDMRPSQASYRSYERVGNQFEAGYVDGRNADLGPSGKQVAQNGPAGIEG
ncbi:MAG TPA: DUF2786 domain-containing protein [Trebonia sp.]|nr:DUF2786 domain-containing protein [Trebonia sp.]